MRTNAHQQPNIANLLTTLMQNCGAHGIPNIGRASSYHRRIIWALLFVFSLVVFSGIALSMYHTFKSYDVAVNVVLEYDRETTFPAVTLCNLNRIKHSALFQNVELRQLIKHYDENTAAGYVEVDYTSADGEYSLTLQTQDIISKMSYEGRVSTGHKLADMILTCTFKGYPCTVVNFTLFYNALYGNCFTFNFFSESARKVTRAGPLYGLTMELFIQQDEYLPCLQQSSGIRVLVGSQNQMPFPEDEGITVSPGQETSIAVRKVNVDRLAAPYITKCTTTQSTIFSDFFNNVTYSKQACEKSCLSEFVLEACSCADQRYKFNDTQLPCLSTNQNQEQCNADVVKDYISGVFPCDCSLPCREELFELTVSNAQWPIDGYKSQVLSALYELSEYSVDELSDDFVEKNVVKFNVYFGGLLHEHIYEIPAYDVTRFISDIGGQVGLWMGVSILTFFELSEFIFDLIKAALLRLKDKMKVTSTVVKVKPFDTTNSTDDRTVSISSLM